MTADDLVANFEFLEDWDARFAYLIDLGKKLDPLPEADKTQANRVHGCQATVWLRAALTKDQPPVLDMAAESDAHIVNGLIAIMLILFNRKTPQAVLDLDADAVLRQLDLEEHLSPTRRNGLHAMLKRIRELAAAHASPSP